MHFNIVTIWSEHTIGMNPFCFESNPRSPRRIIVASIRSIGKSVRTAAVVGLVVVAAIAINHTFIHWQLPFGNSVESTIEPAAASEITKIEPIVLDCRARITANVPVKGKKSYQFSVFGATKTYRTDSMKLKAVGDVDTCVRGGASTQELKDGGWIVTVPAKSIVFNRPRVNAIKTAQSVKFNKGWVGKFTDVMPWVSETNGLTPAGYAYAQTVVGGSSCMKAAWEHTKHAIIVAYLQQASAKHIDPKKVSVIIDGPPDFNQVKGLKDAHFHGFTFKVDAKHVECKVRKGALQLTHWAKWGNSGVVRRQF